MTAVPLAVGMLAALVTGGAALAVGWGLLGSALLALGSALAAGAVAHRWAAGRSGTAAAPRTDEVSLAGRDGTVVTAVPGPLLGSARAAAGAPARGAGGEVSLVVEGHVVRLEAYADLPLAVGAPVRVVRVLSPTSVLVAPR